MISRLLITKGWITSMEIQMKMFQWAGSRKFDLIQPDKKECVSD